MYETFKLNNGIQVIAQPISGLRSISIGVWIKAGSIQETDTENGVSHFIEHMLFKGTKNRSAKEIAGIIDNLGGDINAFTSKECTCFYARVLDEHIDIAVDVLNDMFQNSEFYEDDIRKEKMIILDEIFMYEDSPEDLVYDLLSEQIFKGHPLGRPILGTENSVKALTRDMIVAYMKKAYTSENIVISVAGHYDIKALESILNKSFGQADLQKREETGEETPQFHSGYIYKSKEIEQIHLNVGFKGVPFEDDEAYALLVLNNIVGGSTSSHLFQVIREDHGLSYSVYSHLSFYEAMGLVSVYTSMNVENTETITDLMLDIIKKFSTGEISQEEIQQSKEQLKGSYILGLEGTENIMNMMGKSMLFTGHVKSTEDVLSKIEATSVEQVCTMAKKVFTSQNMALAVVGNVEEDYVANIYKKFQAIL